MGPLEEALVPDADGLPSEVPQGWPDLLSNRHSDPEPHEPDGEPHADTDLEAHKTPDHGPDHPASDYQPDGHTDEAAHQGTGLSRV